MTQFHTPGVHVEEISTLPPSVAEVSTAIPAFIGYTEVMPKDKQDAPVVVPVRIRTFLEFEKKFGGPQAANYEVKVDDKGQITQIKTLIDPKSLLFHHVDMYFRNGGGPCYIVSVGTYGTAKAADYEKGLNAIQKEDEPTLILLSDATQLGAESYYQLCIKALQQCNELGDRFTIIDLIKGENNVSSFRKDIQNNYLKYGAAYTPYLQTTLTHTYNEKEVLITGSLDLGVNGPLQFKSGPNGLVIRYSGEETTATAKIFKTNTPDVTGIEFEVANNIITIRGIGEGKTANEVITAWTAWIANQNPGDFALDLGEEDGTGLVTFTTTSGVTLTAVSNNGNVFLENLKVKKTSLYNQIHAALGRMQVTLPPSSAVCGVYASTDRDRGVWKAPANVGLAAVVAPAEKINDSDQAGLNVDPDSGKSINAIRSFAGKGTLVWGARTLAGNDREWRYISVRRLFNLVEESTRKATAFAVFEANNAATWLKVKAMIESYLYGLWERGALMGSTSDQAFYVNVGLGKTMTENDILDGNMIIDIGLAAVRPAEFIVLRFSHKMAEG